MSDQDAIIILLGALLSVGAMLLAVAIVISILTIVAHWKMFTKAGVEGWKSIIPIYSDYVLYKIVWNTKSFLVYVALLVVLSILYSINTAMAQVAFDANGNFVTAGTPNILISVLISATLIACLIWYIRLQLKTAHAYGQTTGFGVGLVLLNTVFILILGFGNSRYVGPQE